MSDTEQTPQSTDVTSPETEGLQARLSALQDLSRASRDEGLDAGAYDQEINEVKILIAKSQLRDHTAAIDKTWLDIEKANKGLEEARRHFDEAKPAGRTAMSDFGKGVLKNVKTLPGFRDIGQFITDGASAPEIAGALVPIIVGKAAMVAAGGVTSGVEANVLAETEVDDIAHGLSRTQGWNYPSAASAEKNAGEVYRMLVDKAVALGVKPEVMIGAYEASMEPLARAKITDVKDQAEVIGTLMQSLKGTRQSLDRAPGDFVSILGGNGSKTFMGSEMAEKGYNDSDLQNAINTGGFLDFFRNIAGGSLEEGAKAADETGSLQTSVAAGTLNVEGNATKGLAPLWKSFLQAMKTGIQLTTAAQEASEDSGRFTVPVGKSASDAANTETEARKRGHDKIAALAQDAQDAITGVEALDQTDAPKFLDGYKNESDLQAASQKAALDKEEQDELGNAPDDDDRQKEISAMFDKRRARLAGDAQADNHNARLQVDKLRIRAWEFALAKQKLVVDAAKVEDLRANKAAGIDPQTGKASNKPTETRDALMAERARLESAVTGRDDFNVARASGEPGPPLYSDEQIKAMYAGIDDIDRKIGRLDLIDAATRADDNVKYEQKEYDLLKQKVLDATTPIYQDISNTTQKAFTDSEQEEVAEKKADNTINAKRLKRDKAFESQIKEAQSQHNGEKAKQLSLTRQWWKDYDQELDSGKPEWEARQKADQESSGGAMPGTTVASRGGHIGESLAAAGAAYQSRGSVQDISQLLASSQKIETAINNLTTKVTSTRFKVTATYA